MRTPSTVPRPILIAGPTASGKSGLALALAERLGGTVINADSMQVYRELRHPHGAARRGGRGARAACALRLCQRGGGLLGRALCRRRRHGPSREAQAAGPRADRRRRHRALFQGAAGGPVADPGRRPRGARLLARRGGAPPGSRVACPSRGARSRDGGAPDADRHPAHRARAGGSGKHRPIAGRVAARARPPVLAEAETMRLLVLPERQAQGAADRRPLRCHAGGGSLDEVRALLARGFSTELPIMRALGVAPLAAHLAGTLPLDEAVATAKADTRKYAKRQLTWLRRNMIAWKVHRSQYMERFAEKTYRFIIARVDPAIPARYSSAAPAAQPGIPRARDMERSTMTLKMTGAEMVIRALADQGVEHIFGYPGGAVLPIYDELFQQEKVQHVLVRQEGGAVHAAEGYARSTGKVGVVLVTSGPGATNAVTGLTDALMDSMPVVCITGQVPTHLIGNDAFQECDTVGITRPCTKHNWLVKSVDDLAPRPARGVLRRPHRPARAGRGGHPQGRAVRHRHLHRPQGREAQDLPAARQGRPGGHRRGDRADVARQEARALHRRRRHQLRPQGEPAAARAGAAHALSHHLDADGARRLPGLGQGMARHARHARHLRGQPRHARLRRDGVHRRALRRPHHRPPRCVLAQAPRRSTSTSTRPPSTRTCASTCPSSATSPTCWRS